MHGPKRTISNRASKHSRKHLPAVGYENLSAEVEIKEIITGEGEKGDEEGQLLSHLDRPGDNPIRLVLHNHRFMVVWQ